MSKELVRTRIDWLKSKNAEVSALSREESMRILADIARDNSPLNAANRIRAIQENNRMNGWVEDKFNVKGEGIVFNLGNLLD